MKFEVTKYSFKFNYDSWQVQVTCVNGKESVVIALSKDNFEFWLLRNNRLKWEITKTEGEVHRIEEVEGTMSFDEYWEQDVTTAFDDLRDYISSRKMENYYQMQLRKIN